MKQGQKVYVTKYCLTSGIKEEQVKGVSINGSKQYVRVDENFYTLFTLGKEVFETYEEAVKDAEKRRDAKIKQLQKQISKLEKLKFA